MTKILLTIPTLGDINEMTSMTAARLSQRNDVDLVIVKGRPTDYVRNSIVRLFLDRPDYTHILTLDSDIAPPLDCIDRLLALDAPLAAGCYSVLMPGGLRWAVLNKDPYNHYHLLEKLDSLTEPFFADAAGMGCCMIRRDVLDKLHWPWFRWVENENGSQQSEDIYFFRKCNGRGLRVKIDPQIICRHFKTLDITSLMLAKTQKMN